MIVAIMDSDIARLKRLNVTILSFRPLGFESFTFVEQTVQCTTKIMLFALCCECFVV